MAHTSQHLVWEKEMSRHFDPPSQVVILRQEIREENRSICRSTMNHLLRGNPGSTKAVGCKQQITYLVERMVGKKRERSSRIFLRPKMIAASEWGRVIVVAGYDLIELDQEGR
jgi:hypothetical protein